MDNKSNKLGFVVGHPTQFEGPFYQYISKHHGFDAISVYFYDYVNLGFKDPELGSSNKSNSYGIDLLSGYKWCDVSKWNFKTITDILKFNKYVIISGYNYKLAVVLLFTALILRKKIGIKLDSVLWNNKGITKKIYKKSLLSLLNLCVDKFWVTGSASREYLNYFGIHNNKIGLFSYIVDNDWFKAKSDLAKPNRQAIREKLNIPESSKVIICVAKLIQRESPIDLINAFYHLQNPNAVLLIVGDGNERQNLEQFVKNELNNDNIIFVGFIHYLELPIYYSISNLFVHPARDEPWGVSVQEAMACDLPVISSNYVGAGYSLIFTGVNGFIYEWGNISDLTNKIELALQFDIEKVIAANQKILKDWNYQSTWTELSTHIDMLDTTNTKIG